MLRKDLLKEARLEVLKAMAYNGVTGMTIDMVAEMVIKAVMLLRPDFNKLLVDDPAFTEMVRPAQRTAVSEELPGDPDDYYFVVPSESVHCPLDPLRFFDDSSIDQATHIIWIMIRANSVIRHTLRASAVFFETKVMGDPFVSCRGYQLLFTAIAKKL